MIVADEKFRRVAQGRGGGKGKGGEKGGVMTQSLYAHMNKGN
jgi:hypothetical protein